VILIIKILEVCIWLNLNLCSLILLIWVKQEHHMLTSNHNLLNKMYILMLIYWSSLLNVQRAVHIYCYCWFVIARTDFSWQYYIKDEALRCETYQRHGWNIWYNEHYMSKSVSHAVSTLNLYHPSGWYRVLGLIRHVMKIWHVMFKIIIFVSFGPILIFINIRNNSKSLKNLL
jgi:hypothetical protein